MYSWWIILCFSVQNELKLIYDQFDPNIGAEAGPEHASGIGTQVRVWNKPVENI